MKEDRYLRALIRFLSESRHETYGGFEQAPVSELELWSSLIREEAEELLEALKEEDVLQTADGVADLLYVVFGACVSLNLPVGELFDEVHRSNMTKLGGGAEKRNDGKIEKGAEYSPPDISGVLARHQVDPKP